MTSDDSPGVLASETWVAVRLTGVLLLIAGVVYPLVLWLVSSSAFSGQAEGSLAHDAAGHVVGSAMIGQAFARPEYFHSRPSAAGYDASNSSGSNIGPTNPQLLAGNGGSYAGVTAYASTDRHENGLGPNRALPSDGVTASGSGLDPTPLANFIELLAIAVLPAALTHTFGRMTGHRRDGWILYAAMVALFVAGVAATTIAESKGVPSVSRVIGSSGVMEGKEVRFGVPSSVLAAVVTSNGATGSYNAMHDSFTPLGGMIPLVNMLLEKSPSAAWVLDSSACCSSRCLRYSPRDS